VAGQTPRTRADTYRRASWDRLAPLPACLGMPKT
jgi:hypothetical protein